MAGLPDELRAVSLSQRADTVSITALGIDDEGIYLALATRLEGAVASIQGTR